MMGKIVLVGQPIAGKTSLLEALARHWGLSKRINVIASSNQDEITSSSGRIGALGMDLKISTTKGALFEKANVRGQLLRGASVVCFVFNPPIEGLGFPIELQWADFNECVAQASQLGVGPSQVPWLAVITKIELGRTSDFQNLPARVAGPFEVDSYTGVGIPVVAAAVIHALRR